MNTDNFVEYSKSLFVLYLIISGNFLANIFGCKTQELMNTNMYVKHFLGFMTLLFFVILTNTDNISKSSDINYKLFTTVLIYTVFLISTRLDYKYWVFFIFMMASLYVIDLYKKADDINDERKNKLKDVQKSIIYINIVVLIIGFLIYFGKKKIEYGKNFDLTLFFVGKPICKMNNDGGKALSDIDAIKNVL
jgi:hypothetical protein